VILLLVNLVLKAATSQRGAAAVLAMVGSYIPGLKRLPCANSGRLWLMRLGLYELTREKTKADDWVWIMDHTVQLGPWKCLVIVGVRLSAWNPQRGPLKHEDLTLFNLTPMEHSTGKAVAKQLQATIQQTGIVPVEVLSDEGAELKTGMELVKQQSPEAAKVLHRQDIKHKVAALLKHELHDDERWQSFVTKSNRTKLQVTLTPLAFLVPPSLRNKARYMNVDTLVNWGNRALAFLEDPRDFPDEPIDRERLEQKLGWLRGYLESLSDWAELLEVGKAAEAYVREEGYHCGAGEELDKRLTPPARSAASVRLKTGLLTFLAKQSEDVPAGQHLLGSSEVLESLLGKYKRIQGAHSKGGMTGALLNIGATLLEKTPAMIQKALATVRVNDVTQWLRDKLGLTIPARQALVLRANKNVLQNGPVPQSDF
jgi:hypothetical protein